MGTGAGDKHSILLIEDNEDAAQEVIDLLKLHGYDVVHADSAEKAEELISANRFCLLIADLSIPMRKDGRSKPSIESGEAVIGHCIRLNHRRNAGDVLFKPILVFSAHLDDRDIALRNSQDRERGIIDKPLSRNKPPFIDKVAEALRRAGRERHDRCPFMDFEARGQAPGAGEARGERFPIRLEPVRKRGSARIGIQIDGRPVFLTRGSLVMLLKMARIHLRKETATLEQITEAPPKGDGPESTMKAISLLNDQTEKAAPSARKLVYPEVKQYRLNPEYRIEAPLDLAAFAKLEDEGLMALAEAVQKLLGLPKPPAG